MIGRPVTVAIDSAAPPRASPSSLVSTTPSKPTPSRNACGRGDRVLADHRVDDEQDLVGRDGVADVARPAASAPRRSPSRPAVSTMTTSYSLVARVLDRRRGPPRPGRRRRCRARARRPATPARSPTTCSWLTALGRCRSAATSSGVWPWLCEPAAPACRPASSCRRPAGPASMITVGGVLAKRSRRVSPPRIADELLVDDLDDLLRRVQRLRDLRAERPLLDRGDELADDGQRDVGLEQRDADLAARSRRCRPRTAGPCRAGS